MTDNTPDMLRHVKCMAMGRRLTCGYGPVVALNGKRHARRTLFGVSGQAGAIHSVLAVMVAKAAHEATALSPMRRGNAQQDGQ
jgi:hypothetical protein